MCPFSFIIGMVLACFNPVSVDMESVIVKDCRKKSSQIEVKGVMSNQIRFVDAKFCRKL